MNNHTPQFHFLRYKFTYIFFYLFLMRKSIPARHYGSIYKYYGLLLAYHYRVLRVQIASLHKVSRLHNAEVIMNRPSLKEPTGILWIICL